MAAQQPKMACVSEAPAGVGLQEAHDGVNHSPGKAASVHRFACVRSKAAGEPFRRHGHAPGTKPQARRHRAGPRLGRERHRLKGTSLLKARTSRKERESRSVPAGWMRSRRIFLRAHGVQGRVDSTGREGTAKQVEQARPAA